MAYPSLPRKRHMVFADVSAEQKKALRRVARALHYDSMSAMVRDVLLVLIKEADPKGSEDAIEFDRASTA